MEASHRFFCNRACAYFPCHTTTDEDAFNCLFCYCPLYTYEDCGGNLRMVDGIKHCTDCLVPHHPSGYDIINQKIMDRNRKMRERYMNNLDQTLERITNADEESERACIAAWDLLSKPEGSLGALETSTAKIAGMMRTAVPKINKTAVIVFAADNGVASEGVCSAPPVFTQKLGELMLEAKTGVCTIAEACGSDVFVVNIGVAGDWTDARAIDRCLRKGSGNIVKEAAMTREEAIRAIEIGIALGDRYFAEGYDMLGAGEVGMGNTTTAAAVFSALSGRAVDEVCGKGAGITQEAWEHKKDVIRTALEHNHPDAQDPVDVMAKVGGFDICGMCGLFLSGAKNHRPVVIDGFISSVAALCAVRLKPEAKDYLLPSHLSQEVGAKYVMEELELKPLFHFDMRLGEGTGCPFTFHMVRTALHTLEHMGTLEEIALGKEHRVDLRGEENHERKDGR